MARFNTQASETILVKVGISAVSMENARQNLQAEVPHWSFEKVHHDAKEMWQKELQKIEIEGGSLSQQRTFYTAMYHTLLAPNLFMDINGDYRGMDRQIHRADGFTNYTVFSLWDTFRTLHPLLTITHRQLTGEWIKTLLAKYKEGGRLPIWELAGNYRYYDWLPCSTSDCRRIKIS